MLGKGTISIYKIEAEISRLYNGEYSLILEP